MEITLIINAAAKQWKVSRIIEETDQISPSEIESALKVYNEAENVTYGVWKAGSAIISMEYVKTRATLQQQFAESDAASHNLEADNNDGDI